MWSEKEYKTIGQVSDISKNDDRQKGIKSMEEKTRQTDCSHNWQRIEWTAVPETVKEAIAAENKGSSSFACVVSNCTKCGQYGYQIGYSVADINIDDRIYLL